MATKSNTWELARQWLGAYTMSAPTFLPDEIVRDLRPSVDNSGWQYIPGFWSAGDSNIWSYIQERLPGGLTGSVLLITDQCFSPNRCPFLVDVERIEPLVSSFVDDHGDEMFGGDWLLIHPDALIMVHHEGMYCVVSNVVPASG